MPARRSHNTRGHFCVIPDEDISCMFSPENNADIDICAPCLKKHSLYSHCARKYRCATCHITETSRHSVEDVSACAEVSREVAYCSPNGRPDTPPCTPSTCSGVFTSSAVRGDDVIYYSSSSTTHDDDVLPHHPLPPWYTPGPPQSCDVDPIPARSAHLAPPFERPARRVVTSPGPPEGYATDPIPFRPAHPPPPFTRPARRFVPEPGWREGCESILHASRGPAFGLMRQHRVPHEVVECATVGLVVLANAWSG
ncbi:hypothetical protein BJ875DRAFT_62966 [Amylocarpus encephaloides]|uniref:Uncharacterized protein n=1 Tax=Amylocarpus encephaloides TaxID=45428 RepID=A0A9P7YRV7_9HELO|nr:hypothetical protein BJ875DRAFT_62966 [Amylocarpus encephaloides]